LAIIVDICCPPDNLYRLIVDLDNSYTVYRVN